MKGLKKFVVAATLTAAVVGPVASVAHGAMFASFQVTTFYSDIEMTNAVGQTVVNCEGVSTAWGEVGPYSTTEEYPCG